MVYTLIVHFVIMVNGLPINCSFSDDYSEWFTHKLFMRKKNVVVLLDTGDTTKMKTSQGQNIQKLQYLKDGAHSILNSLTWNDRVSSFSINTIA